LIIISFTQGLYLPTAPYFIPTSQKLNNYFSLVIFIFLLSPAIMEFNNSRVRRGIDLNTPRLLKDLTEAVKSGLPLFRALEEATTRDYGPISKPLESAMVKFRLTLDLNESLRWLGNKLDRPSIKRMCVILISANQTGGDVVDVLITSTSMITDLIEFREERYSQMKPYTFIVYFGTTIFVIISWLILVRFISPLAASTTDPLIAQSNVFTNILDVNFYKSILFWATIFEAIFGGLVAGKITEGRINSGLIHSVILVFITIIFFNLFTV
jgi:flagellar protein FlaJ